MYSGFGNLFVDFEDLFLKYLLEMNNPQYPGDVRFYQWEFQDPKMEVLWGC